MIETKTGLRGVCCDSCQEDVNVHCCEYCGETFESGEIIFCEHYSQQDCSHFHKQCKETIDKKDKTQDLGNGD